MEQKPYGVPLDRVKRNILRFHSIKWNPTPMKFHSMEWNPTPWGSILSSGTQTPWGSTQLSGTWPHEVPLYYVEPDPHGISLNQVELDCIRFHSIKWNPNPMGFHSVEWNLSRGLYDHTLFVRCLYYVNVNVQKVLIMHSKGLGQIGDWFKRSSSCKLEWEWRKWLQLWEKWLFI